MTVIDFAEARKTKRRRVLDTGLIRFGDMSICCVVRNLSEAGAALDIGSQVGIPDQFTLIVVPQKKIYSCGVVWRKDRRIGVRFASPIGIGGNLAAPPSHTTGHTGPYPAVQRIEHRRSFTPCRRVRHWSPSQRLRSFRVARPGFTLSRRCESQ